MAPLPTVLITGANRGIGLELARQYQADGWRVLAACREPAQAVELQQLVAQSPRTSVHRLDVTQGEAVGELAREFSAQPIDVLINNAGVFGPRGARGQDFGTLEIAAWRDVLETNLLGALRVAEAFLPALLRGEQRKLIAVTSIMGSISGNDGRYYAYRTSKAALNCAMKGLARDLANRRVIVAAVHPGWVKTEMGGQAASVAVAESASGMRRVIARLTLASSGNFYDFRGQALPW